MDIVSEGNISFTSFKPRKDLEDLSRILKKMPIERFAYVEVTADGVTFVDMTGDERRKITIQPVMSTEPVVYGSFSPSEVADILVAAPAHFGSRELIISVVKRRLDRGTVFKADDSSDMPHKVGDSFYQMHGLQPA